jgi:hypothetical protein
VFENVPVNEQGGTLDVKDAAGGDTIFTTCETVSAQPLLSDTISVTLYVPGCWYVCCGLAAVEKLLSPKFQLKFVDHSDRLLNTHSPVQIILV